MLRIITLTGIACMILSCQNPPEKDPEPIPVIVAPDSTKTVKKEDVKESTIGYAPVNGINMYYEIQGEGEPLILVHGGGSTINTSFGKILPFLSAKYKTISVELQAHGHTNDRPAPSSFEQDADDVAGLLAFLKIDKASFFGFSNGGNTCLQIGIRHPQIVDKLVIVSAFYKRDGLMKGFFDMMKNASLDSMPEPLKKAYLDINNDQKALQTMHDRDKNRMLAFKDWPEDSLKAIKSPVLLISSDKDVVTPQHTIEMSKKIPNAELIILPGIHGACIGEICTSDPKSKMPAITAAIIDDFLNKETDK